MTFSIWLFIFSLLGVIALFGAKFLELRLGKRTIILDISNKAGDTIAQAGNAVTDRISVLKSEAAREKFLSLLALMLSFLVTFSFKVKRLMSLVFAKWIDVIRGKRFLSHKGSASFFLKDVMEYKQRLTKER